MTKSFRFSLKMRVMMPGSLSFMFCFSKMEGMERILIQFHDTRNGRVYVTQISIKSLFIQLCTISFYFLMLLNSKLCHDPTIFEINFFNFTDSWIAKLHLQIVIHHTDLDFSISLKSKQQHPFLHP